MNKLSVIEIQRSSTQDSTHIFIPDKAAKNRLSDRARLLSTATSFSSRLVVQDVSYHNPAKNT